MLEVAVTGDCPSDDLLSAFVDRRLDEHERIAVESHCRACERCRASLSQVILAFASARTSLSVDASKSEVDDRRRYIRGSVLGRYVVLREVGRGAMGVVYAAYDPELDRKIALKVLHDTTHAGGEELWRARMIREARALAAVSHANVLTVHDAGRHGDDVFIAMELVDGQTLSTWIATTRPSQRAVLDVLIAAGRGLAAAHDHALVHRDFKPDNVLVGRDGSVRVSDFGLARFELERHAGESDLRESGARPRSLDVGETVGVVGTPIYMAPEQHRGEAATAQSDQYGFCATAWEALCGAGPFDLEPTPRTGSVARLRELKDAGPPSWSGPRMSRHIVEALRRGLAPDPTERWASMAELLEILAADRGRRRKRFGAVIGGVGIVGIAGIMGPSTFGVAYALVQRQNACRGAANHLEDGWGEERRAAVADAWHRTRAPYAGASWTNIETLLDDYAQRWVELHEDTCAATRLRGEQSETVMDLRMACLWRSRVALEATMNVFAGADEAVIENAYEVVAGLPPLERCSDVAALTTDSSQPPAPENAERVEHAFEVLAEAQALNDARAYEAALVQLEELEPTVGDLEYAPLRIEMELVRGEALSGLSRWNEAERDLQVALNMALRHGERRDLLRATQRLGFVVGYGQTRMKEGLELLNIARGLSERADMPLIDVVRTANAVGVVLQRQGNYEAAEVELRRGLTLAEGLEGAARLYESRLHNNLAALFLVVGRYDEARRTSEQGLELLSELVGAEHPANELLRAKLGSVFVGQGQFEAAEAHARESVRIAERIHGPRHAAVAEQLVHLGHAQQGRGHHEEAEASYRRAIALIEDTFGPEHLETTLPRVGLGDALHRRGRLREAEAAYRQAVAIRERHLGPDHVDVAYAKVGLANLLHEDDEFSAAAAAYEQVLSVFTKTLGHDHPHVAGTMVNRAHCLEKQGLYREAEAAYRSAAEMLEARQGVCFPHTVAANEALAVLLESRGRAREAFEVVAPIWTRCDGVGDANLAFLLAEAVGSQSEQWELAREVAIAVREAHARANDPRRRVVERWLAKRRR